jgi:2-methylcitrate dehydratase PrpD
MKRQNGEVSIAEVLADFVSSRTFEDLPGDAIEKAKGYALDCLGCIIGASRERQAAALFEVIKGEGGRRHSSVFARGFKTSVMNAALVNGTTGHIFDFDDDHREGTMHPSIAVLPAVFALGEKMKVGGRDLIRGFVLGLEVMIRVGEAFLGKSYYQGFHPTGTCGVFGAATGCSSLLGLDAKRTAYALGLAGSFASGTLEWRTEGSWQKPLQAGHPAMFGILSALLAEKGFVGARTIFDGPDGVIRAFSFKDQYDYTRIIDNLGHRWEMNDTSIKIHACCRFGAPVADCAIDLYRQGVRAKDVRRIVAKVGDFTIRVLCTPQETKYRPVTHVDAQFSLPYTVAAAICRNRTGPDEFKEEALHDEQILDLAKKVTWELDPSAESLYPTAYPATLLCTLNDGREFVSHVDYPKGDTENPVSMKEIVDKFELLTEHCFDKKRRAAIVGEVSRLEETADVSTLADLLR